MATWKQTYSGGTASSQYEARLTYTESVDTANNRSTITLKLETHSKDGNYTHHGYSERGRIYVNGSLKVDKTTTPSVGTSWVTLCSTTQTINHNADGSKTITIGFIANSGYAGTAHPSDKSWTLTKINRDFTSTPSISSSNITAESVKINWSTSQACDLIKYKLNNGSWVQAWTGNASSGNFTISGLNSNTSYTIVGDFRRRDTGRTKNSNTITIKTKPRPIRIYIDGAWKVAKPYVRVDGVWKEAKPYVRINGVWKEGN